MDRRTFLKTSTAAAAATTATAGAARAGTKLETPAIVASRIEFAIGVSPGGHARDATEQFASSVQMATGGRIIFNVTDAPVPIGAFTSGSLDGAAGSLADLCGAPSLALFTGLPGELGLAPELHLSWLSAAGGNLFADEGSAEFGAKPLLIGHTGDQPGLWSNAEVRGLKEFAHAELRVHALGNQIVDRLRESFMPSAPSEPLTIELTEFLSDPLLALMHVAPEGNAIWYRDGIHKHGFATSLVLSLDRWHALSGADQALLEALARTALQSAIERDRVNRRLVLPGLLQAHTIQRRPLPADVAAAIAHTATAVTHDAMNESAATSRAFQAYGTFYEAMTGLPLPKPNSGRLSMV